jgi:formylglycine-generating enzyme required for sulfatase activity
MITNSVGMRLALVPAGQFEMGSLPSEKGRHPDEMRHGVKLSRAYSIGITEVTRREWKAVMGNSGPGKAEDDELPETGVRWAEAVRFCEKLSEKEGRRYRLPTEAEWERACRAGKEGPFGGAAADEVAWHGGNSGEAPQPVARLNPNAWGLYDMHGNAMEWCSDWYQERLGRDLAIDPTGPAEGEGRVARGGSFLHRTRAARASARHSLNPASSRHLGLRVVLETTNEPIEKK